MLILRGTDIQLLRAVRPDTHEIGGVIVTGDDGSIVDFSLSTGGKCRDMKGNLLPNVTNCSVMHHNGEIVFHTHPRANRPSSTDLAVAVSEYPRRKLNLIFTPRGLWAYAPSKTLSERMTHMNHDELRRHIMGWRFIGHTEQENTQNNECRSYCMFLRNEGFKTWYIPYHDILTDSTFTFDY